MLRDGFSLAESCLTEKPNRYRRTVSVMIDDVDDVQ